MMAFIVTAGNGRNDGGVVYVSAPAGKRKTVAGYVKDSAKSPEISDCRRNAYQFTSKSEAGKAASQLGSTGKVHKL